VPNSYVEAYDPITSETFHFPVGVGLLDRLLRHVSELQHGVVKTSLLNPPPEGHLFGKRPLKVASWYQRKMEDKARHQARLKMMEEGRKTELHREAPAQEEAPVLQDAEGLSAGGMEREEQVFGRVESPTWDSNKSDGSVDMHEAEHGEDGEHDESPTAPTDTFSHANPLQPVATTYCTPGLGAVAGMESALAAEVARVGSMHRSLSSRLVLPGTRMRRVPTSIPGLLISTPHLTHSFMVGMDGIIQVDEEEDDVDDGDSDVIDDAQTSHGIHHHSSVVPPVDYVASSDAVVRNRSNAYLVSQMAAAQVRSHAFANIALTCCTCSRCLLRLTLTLCAFGNVKG